MIDGLLECDTAENAIDVCVRDSEQRPVSASYSGLTRVTAVTPVPDPRSGTDTRCAGTQVEPGATLIALESTDTKQQWDLVLRMPGFGMDRIHVGDELDFSLSASGTTTQIFPEAVTQTISLARAGEPLLFAHSSHGAKFSTPDFAVEHIELMDHGAACFHTLFISPSCSSTRHEAQVRIGDDMVLIAAGDSLELGGWLVTLDRFDEPFRPCDGAAATEFTAVRLP